MFSYPLPRTKTIAFVCMNKDVFTFHCYALPIKVS